MTIDIAVCDDDSKDLENTTDMVRDILVEYNDMYSLQIFHSVADMLNKVNKVDIAILDISMEEMNVLI